MGRIRSGPDVGVRDMPTRHGGTSPSSGLDRRLIVRTLALPRTVRLKRFLGPNRIHFGG